MASKLADLVVNIEARTARLESQLNKAERSFRNSAGKIEKSWDRVNRGMDRVRSNLKGLAVAAGAAIAAYATGALFRSLIETNKQYESLSAALETVTGSAEKADKEFKKLQEFAANTPFALEQSITAFIRLSTLGIEPTEERMMSFGNTASAFSKDMIQFIEAVADASVFEFERLKEFGIKARQETDAVAFTFRGNTTKIAKDAESIINYLTEIGQVDFAGAMERQMAGLPGKLSNLEDSFNNLKFAIGRGGFTDAVADAAEEMAKFINEIIDSGAAASIGQVLGDAFWFVHRAVVATTDAFAQMAQGYQLFKAIITGDGLAVMQQSMQAAGFGRKQEISVPPVEKSANQTTKSVSVPTVSVDTGVAGVMKRDMTALNEKIEERIQMLEAERQYWDDVAAGIKGAVDLEGNHLARVKEIEGAYKRGLITAEDRYKALTIAAKDHNEQVKRMKLLVGDFADGAQVAMQDYYDSINDGAQRAYAFFSRTIQSMEDVLTDFFSTGKMDFQSFVDGIIRDMNRLLIQRLVMPQLLGGLNSIAPGIEGILQSGTVPAGPSLAGGASLAGGNTTNVSMSIMTPNADSFRKSEDQMLRELKMKMARVNAKG